MIRVIRAGLVLVVIVALASLAAWLADHPGQFVAQWQGWRIEMSVAVAFVIGLLGVAVVAALFIVLGELRPKSLMARKRGFDSARGYKALTNGLVAIAAGDPDEALKQAKRARGLLKDAPATLLISAQAAEMRGDHDEARKQFTAMLEAPETEFVGLRGLMVEAVRAGDRTRARALVRRAHALRPKTPWVLEAMFGFECEAGEWKNASQALEARAKAGLEDNKTVLNRKRAVLFAEQSITAEGRGFDSDALELALKAHRLSPGLPHNAMRAAKLLAQGGKVKKARSVLAEAFAALPHPALLAADAALDPAEKPKDRLKRIEKFAARAGDAPMAELAVADAAIQAANWKRAGEALAAVPDAKKTRRHWQLEAERLRRGVGRADEAREAMMKAAAASDPLWRCKSCGRTSERWQAVCPSCLSFDSQDWTVSDTKGVVVQPDLEIEPPRTVSPEPPEPVSRPTPAFDPPRRKPDPAPPSGSPPLAPADFGGAPEPDFKPKPKDEIVVLDNPLPPSHQGVPRDDDDDFNDPQAIARQTP